LTGISQPELPPAEQAPIEEPDIERLSWITDDHIAVWDVGKMSQVIAICRSLTTSHKRGSTAVRTFEAPTRRTPRPHTWGEVAFVQGRIIAGTWLPANRLWIKIIHEKELLGQAIFDKGLLNGADKCDLPQTLKRPSISECQSWCADVNAIEGRLPVDFAPPTDETQGIDFSQFPEHVDILARSHAMDVEWARFCAIDRDKWERIRRATIDRIEATFTEATHRAAGHP
jgi:hypothetical protein